MIMSITATTGMTTSDMLPRALIVMAALFFAPMLVAVHAAESRATEARVSDHGHLGEAIKRDAKAVGAAFKEGAHRIGVASKAVAHEIATAAKRGATETRAALRGQKVNTPAT
jgi:hypothetical protein